MLIGAPVFVMKTGGYAHYFLCSSSYIHHSNRGLRQLNMHLNMRRPPTTIPSFFPDFLRPSSGAKSPASPQLNFTRPTSAAPGVKSPNTSTSTAGLRRPSHNATVMSQISPSSNPRGELIFSSRVDKSFKEGYERYRNAFERRREEKAMEEARRSGGRWFKRGLSESAVINRTWTPTPPASRRNTPLPGVTGATGTTTAALTQGGRRRRSPSPRPSHLSKSEGAGEEASVKEGNREMAESYSFVLGS